MKLLISFFIFVSGLAFSQESPPESEFKLDQGLVDKLYQESITETRASNIHHSTSVTLSPVFSLFTPTQMTLSNNYFEVPYGTQGMGGVPGISLVASARIFNLGGLHFIGLGGVGYSMKETVQRATSKTASTDRERTTRLTLHWLPLSLGTRMEYRFSGFEAVRPFVQIKGGAEWLYQVGQLDGIEQGFWIPYYQYGGGLTFFDSPSSPDRWFGGLTLGISKHQSISSPQVLNGTVVDVGVNILL